MLRCPGKRKLRWAGIRQRTQTHKLEEKEMVRSRKFLAVAALALVGTPMIAAAQTAPAVTAIEVNADHSLLGIKVNTVPQVLAFELQIPQVQYVIRLYAEHALGTDLVTYLPLFLQADPQAYIRCTAEGQSTSNGSVIPGFTVGVANCNFQPPM
jgi:hypothetical protein